MSAITITQELDLGHRQWASRPDHERWLDLPIVISASEAFADKTIQTVVRIGDLNVRTEAGDLRLVAPKGKTEFSYNAFGQMTKLLGIGRMAPDMRRQPAELARQNLEWGMEQHADKQIKAYLVPPNGENGNLLAVNSPEFGRIFQHRFFRSIHEMNVRMDNIWQSPPGTGNPLRDATIYWGPLTDAFVFLCDEGRGGFEIDGQEFKRAFFAWNSEFGDRSWGVTSFTYQRICGNRFVWGGGNIQEFRGIHSKGAPDRFAEIAGPALDKLANEDLGKVIQTIAAAKHKVLAPTVEDVRTYLTVHKWSPKVIDGTFAIIDQGDESTGVISSDPTNLFNLISGATAYARDIPNQDDRLNCERTAGSLLDLVAVK